MLQELFHKFASDLRKQMDGIVNFCRTISCKSSPDSEVVRMT